MLSTEVESKQKYKNMKNTSVRQNDNTVILLLNFN